jgi:hypothetical protein
MRPAAGQAGFAEALAEVNFEDVQTDLKALFLDSKEQWPGKHHIMLLYIFL